MKKNIDKIDTRNSELKTRFILGEKRETNLVIVGINPSIATLDKLDPTAKRVKKYGNLLENRGWLIINLYPQISTNVELLDVDKNEEIFIVNNEYIDSVLKEDNIILVAAWGESIKLRKYLKDCLFDIDLIAKKYGHDWHCFELTKYGHPCHPLFRRKGFRFYETKLNKFNFNQYFRNL